MANERGDLSRFVGDAASVIAYDRFGFQIDTSTGERVPGGGQVDPETGMTITPPIDLATGKRVVYDEFSTA